MSDGIRAIQALVPSRGLEAYENETRWTACPALDGIPACQVGPVGLSHGTHDERTLNVEINGNRYTTDLTVHGMLYFRLGFT